MRFPFIILLVFSSLSCFGQGFWLTTRDFPGGPKTAFTSVEDSVLFVGTSSGIWKSGNEGFSWTKNLSSSYIFSIHASSDGTLVAGGAGKIFFSKNKGASWDSVPVSTAYPIIKIIENKEHEYFFIASGFTNDQGFVGDGIFFNSGDLKIWVKRNTGLPTHLRSAEQLAIDKTGRLYVALPDENTSGSGGLYFSDNKGLNWQQSPLFVTNLGTIKVLNSFAISITPQDSVMVSVSGTAVNISTRLNLIKHINDVAKNAPWRPWSIRKAGNWWEDLNLNNIHFAKNGDWYSSVSNSISTGGSFYSTDKGLTWVRRTTGMGISRTDRYESNFHYESSTGKVFMVQLLDERVYYTNQSLLNPVTLSGTIKDDQGKPLGVAIAAKNMLIGSDAQGEFSVIVPRGWSGKITPELSSHMFEPESVSITDAQVSSGNINFIGKYIGTYFVSGYVTDVSGQPIAQIPIEGFPQNVFTNEFGYYVAEVPAGWTGLVTPVLNGFQFKPASIIVPKVKSNLIDQNFILRKTGVVYILGKVTDERGEPFSTATLSGFPQTTRIDTNGNFFGEVPVGWSGLIIPVAEGYKFKPDKIQVTNMSSDLLNQVLVASPLSVIPKYAISGLIKDQSGAPIENVSFTGLPTETKTITDGSYRAELPAGWSGVVTPVSENFVFSPAFITINNLSAPLTDQNFTAAVITGIDDEETPFRVYPNPSNDGIIHITQQIEAGLRITNSTGQIIWFGNSNAISNFQLPAPGIYMLTLVRQHKAHTLKVLFR
ncbi:MAG: T9SS type A sorting domain-containing protein [Cyclobacteriaceae bacterium]|nr:T9SS type A sorting domain-containing protein [Cyclobacteriaceae bacterium]